MKAFLERHAVAAYVALTYVISWGGLLAVVGGPAHILATPDEFGRLLPLAALTLAAGPSLAGLVMTGLVSGTGGIRDTIRRLLRWRVAARWYAVALLTAPSGRRGQSGRGRARADGDGTTKGVAGATAATEPMEQLQA